MASVGTLSAGRGVPAACSRTSTPGSSRARPMHRVASPPSSPAAAAAARSSACSSIHAFGLQQQQLVQPQPRPARLARLLRAAASADGEANGAAAAAESAFDYEEPETAKEGIDLGLVLCKQGKWQKALQVFEKSLKLPGTGVKRFRDKPRLISDGEKMALLFNIACCHSQLQDARSGLVALGGCLEAGYTDYRQIRSDPDLEFLRADARFEGLMERFERTSSGSGFLGGFDLGGLFKK